MNATIALSSIQPNPFQSRKTIDKDAVERLAKEIEQTGFWDAAFRVRQVDGHYELVFGHQRLEALKLLGRKRIDVDVVKLDDSEMAEQSLIENVQRHNLPEIDKAEAIKRLFDMLQASCPGTTRRGEIIERIRERLGYGNRSSIEEFLAMAAASSTTKQVIRKHNVGRRVVAVARSIGGEAMIQHAAKHGISKGELEPMQTALTSLPKETRAKVVQKIIADEISEPEEVTKLVRREQAKAVRKDEIPPDLMMFVEKWTDDLGTWTAKLRQAKKQKAYIHAHPEIAARFKDAAEAFIAELKELLDLR